MQSSLPRRDERDSSQLIPNVYERFASAKRVNQRRTDGRVECAVLKPEAWCTPVASGQLISAVARAIITGTPLDGIYSVIRKVWALKSYVESITNQPRFKAINNF